MNFRKLLTYFAFGTAAVMPFATAQNPTILQGSYVSNVFGPSNFVLNPNAQTNIASVTTSSATVSRSTTTPLVATSEFNITTSTSTGYADWSTRTFDAGMKNNNCEARFTYRGFTVGTTKAQLIQNSLVIAELTLVGDSTNPKIASINFPCGDLTYATTFRLQQSSASLTGTNEIGAVYVGLATNMANVAQAELVGTWTMTGATNCIFALTVTSYDDFNADSDCNDPVVTGNVGKSQGKRPWINIINPKPGNYYVVVSATFESPTNVSQYVQLKNSAATAVTRHKLYSQGGITNYPTSLTLNMEYTSGSLEFQLGGYTTNAANALNLVNANSDTNLKFTVYRFPSSSELVVTPERAAIKYASNTGGEGTSANTNYTSSTYFSTSESGSLFPNLTQSVANTQTCYDASFGEPIKATDKIEIQYGENTGEWYPIDSSSAQIQAFSYNNGKWYGMYVSIKTASTGLIKTCFGNSGGALTGAYGSATTTDYYTWASAWGSNRRYRIVKIPSTASNSALYVQGPVKAAATGAAVASGYVFEEIPGTAVGDFTYTLGTAANVSSITLQPGVYLLLGQIKLTMNTGSDASTDNAISISSTSNATDGESIIRETLPTSGGSNRYQQVTRLVRVTSATTYYLVGVYFSGSGTVRHINNTQTFFKAIRLN